MGSEEEDVYTTYLNICPLWDEHKDYLKESKTYACVRKINLNQDLLGYIDNYMTKGSKQINRYYYVGKSIFVDYLPDVKVTGISFSTDALREFLRKLTGHYGTIEQIIFSVPETVNYGKYYLQKNYGYNISNNILKHNNKYYKFKSCKYNKKTNELDIICSTLGDYYIQEISSITYDISVNNIITKINNEDVEAIKVTAKRYRQNIKRHIQENQTEPFLVEELHEPILEDTEINIYSYSTNIEGTTYQFKFEADEKVDSEITRYRSLEIDEIVSESKVYDGGEDLKKSISSPNNKQYFVRYKVDTEDNNDEYYFYFTPSKLKEEGITQEPIKELTDKQTNLLKCTPIVLLRHNKTNLNDVGSRGTINSILTEERYKTTLRLFKILGMKLDQITEEMMKGNNAGDITEMFLNLALRAKDEGRGLSKYFYFLFSELLTKFPPIASNDYTTTTLSFHETAMDMNLHWKPISDSIYKDSIGNVGTAKHKVYRVSKTSHKRLHYVIQSRCLDGKPKNRTVKVSKYTEVITRSKPLGEKNPKVETEITKKSGISNTTYSGKNLSSFYHIEAELNTNNPYISNSKKISDTTTFNSNFPKPSGLNPIGKTPKLIVKTVTDYDEISNSYNTHQTYSVVDPKKYYNNNYSKEENDIIHSNYCNPYYLNYNREVIYEVPIYYRDEVVYTSDENNNTTTRSVPVYSDTREYESLYIYYQYSTTLVRRLIIDDLYSSFLVVRPDGVDSHGDNSRGDNFFIPIMWKPFLRLGLMDRCQVYGKCIFLQVHAVHHEVVEHSVFEGALGIIFKIAMYVVSIVLSAVTFGVYGAVFTAVLGAMMFAISFIENSTLRLILTGVAILCSFGAGAIASGANTATSIMQSIGQAMMTQVTNPMNLAVNVAKISLSVAEMYLEGSQKALQEEMEDFSAKAKEREKKLKTAQEDLSKSQDHISASQVYELTHYDSGEPTIISASNSIALAIDQVTNIGYYAHDFADTSVSSFVKQQLKISSLE